MAYCRNNGCDLDTCVSKIRLNEREISRKMAERRRMRNVVRRMSVNKKQSYDLEDVSDDELVIKKARRSDSVKTWNFKEGKSGRIGIDTSLWHKVGDEVQEFVKEYNGAIAHGEDIKNIKIPDNVTIQKCRRNNESISEPGESKQTPSTKRKRIQFNLNNDKDKDE